MRILEVRPLAIPDVRVIRFARYRDHRGFFSELFRRDAFEHRPELTFLSGQPFVQVNESQSRAGVIRGLHFQWNPYVGKLLRTIRGHMVDVAVDVRLGSPTQGRGLIYDMPNDEGVDWSEWIWVPPGFAHGNFFPVETRIEYFCTGQYNPACEASISPLSGDIDWSLAEAPLVARLQELGASSKAALSDKDRNGLSIGQWFADARAAELTFNEDGVRPRRA